MRRAKDSSAPTQPANLTGQTTTSPRLNVYV